MILAVFWQGSLQQTLDFIERIKFTILLTPFFVSKKLNSTNNLAYLKYLDYVVEFPKRQPWNESVASISCEEEENFVGPYVWLLRIVSTGVHGVWTSDSGYASWDIGKRNNCNTVMEFCHVKLIIGTLS